MPGLDCVDTAPVDGEGLCVIGPVDNHCSIASGHPQRGCLNDVDCGGGLNSCETSYRICYPDNGVIGGSVDVAGASTPPVGNTSDPTNIAALLCVAPTAIASVNDVGGFPGLAREIYPGRIDLRRGDRRRRGPARRHGHDPGSGPASVVETSVTTPTGGEVSIVGTFNAGSPPSGYEFLGRLVQITALPATATSPLQISFDIDASEVPPGQDETTIAIFRNGVGPIPELPRRDAGGSRRSLHQRPHRPRRRRRPHHRPDLRRERVDDGERGAVLSRRHRMPVGSHSSPASRQCSSSTSRPTARINCSGSGAREATTAGLSSATRPAPTRTGSASTTSMA